MSAHRVSTSAAFAFLAGVVVAVQGRINGELGHVLADGVLAAVINFGVGLALLVVIIASRASLRSAVSSVPQLVASRRLPWWTLCGGAAGALYVASQGVTVAVLGVALFTVATVAGQTGSSLLVDRVGVGPTGQVPVTTRRVGAAVLATFAVGLAAWGRSGGGGEAVLGFVLLAVAAGAAVAFQAAFNGRVSVATGQPTAAALVNFVVGLATLVVVLVLEHTVGGRAWPAMPAPMGDRGWLYLGGALGLFFIVTAAWTVRALGVLLFSLVVLSGTLLGAVALDVLVPTDGTRITPQLVVGVTLTLVSVALAVGRVPRRQRRAASTV